MYVLCTLKGPYLLTKRCMKKNFFQNYESQELQIVHFNTNSMKRDSRDFEWFLARYNEASVSDGPFNHCPYHFVHHILLNLEYPSCLQTTEASSTPQPALQIVRHVSSTHTSTRPSWGLRPLMSRTSLSVHTAAMDGRQ